MVTQTIILRAAPVEITGRIEYSLCLTVCAHAYSAPETAILFVLSLLSLLAQHIMASMWYYRSTGYRNSEEGRHGRWLTYVLRHGAQRSGLHLSPGGWVKATAVMRIGQMSPEMLFQVLRDDYAAQECRYQALWVNGWWIRATPDDERRWMQEIIRTTSTSDDQTTTCRWWIAQEQPAAAAATMSSEMTSSWSGGVARPSAWRRGIDSEGNRQYDNSWWHQHEVENSANEWSTHSHSPTDDWSNPW